MTFLLCLFGWDLVLCVLLALGVPWFAPVGVAVQAGLVLAVLVAVVVHHRKECA